MYNMEISIGSYKLRVEILIAIVVVFWIMFGHVLCSCCRVNLVEKMTGMTMTSSRTMEGFTGANKSSMGPEFAGAKTPDSLHYESIYLVNAYFNIQSRN